MVRVGSSCNKALGKAAVELQLLGTSQLSVRVESVNLASQKQSGNLIVLCKLQSHRPQSLNIFECTCSTSSSSKDTPVFLSDLYASKIFWGTS